MISGEIRVCFWVKRKKEDDRMGQPYVSVILDNYNYAQYLGAAVESVLGQTYEDFEVILVDDGSTDGSRAVIEAYAARDSRIRPLFKENGGQMSAFNAAFAVARGTVLAFLDSDDYWYPKKLARIVKEHERFRFVQHYLSNNGDGIYRKIDASVNWHKVLMDYGYLYNHSVCSSLSFHRSLLEPLFPMAEENRMRYCADGILAMAALSLTEVRVLEEELGFYRIHGGNGWAGKNDFGEAARKAFAAQNEYVNMQLSLRGFPNIPFSRHRYFRMLVNGLLQDGKLDAGSPVVVYGTESSGLYMTQVLQESGIIIYGYADSSAHKQGREFMGKHIYAPQELLQIRDRVSSVLIASSAGEAIAGLLRGLSMQEGKDFFRLPI